MKIIFVITMWCKLVSTELFTAIEDIKDLHSTEGVLVEILQTYIDEETSKLNSIRKYVDLFTEQHALASKNIDGYFENPINAYLTIKRFTMDLSQVEFLLETNLEEETLASISELKREYLFPTKEDLDGTFAALTRLQNTYNLDVPYLARGEINGIKLNSELSAFDCFELGGQSYDNGDFYHARLWMKEAEIRLGRGNNEYVQKSDVLEYLAFSDFKLGNVTSALELSKKLLELYPDHPRAKQNIDYFRKEFAKSNEMVKTEDELSDVTITKEQLLQIESQDEFRKAEDTVYKKLCRGVNSPSNNTSQLRCYYTNNRNPFLLIAPFKVEQAHKDPYIFIFHDVMYDEEIETFKQIAKPRLKRTRVYNHLKNKSEAVSYRTSKYAWLNNITHEHITNIRKRIEDLTGLTTETVDAMEVANYGIGGHSIPHFDFFKKEEMLTFANYSISNRIATILFYMTDVLYGGATVFPYIDVSVRPKKGTAIFWYNLHPSGEGDIMTRHAACPVLIGSKWITVWWLDERGQEFLRPCDLKPAPPDRTVI